MNKLYAILMGLLLIVVLAYIASLNVFEKNQNSLKKVANRPTPKELKRVVVEEKLLEEKRPIAVVVEVEKVKIEPEVASIMEVKKQMVVEQEPKVEKKEMNVEKQSLSKLDVSVPSMPKVEEVKKSVEPSAVSMVPKSDVKLPSVVEVPQPVKPVEAPKVKTVKGEK